VTISRADRRLGRKRFRFLRNDWELYALLLLPMIFVLIFKYGAYIGLSVAFKDYKILKGFFASKWNGFDNFAKVFAARDFTRAFRNTLLLNGLDLVLGFPAPIILALLLNEVRARSFKRVTQTLLYLPHFLSWVIIGAVAYQLFSLSGIVNTLITNNGAKAIPFLQENTHWLVSYLVIGVWQTMGWGTIVYLAAITGINPELYEAAVVDGANRFKQIIHVTLPSIRPTIITLLIMNLGRVMGGSFERVYSLMNVATTEYTYTIPVLIYNWGIQSSKYSQATALGLFQSVIGLLLVLGSDFIAKRFGEDGLL
jgi:putative aldouronate transport system permease protein